MESCSSKSFPSSTSRDNFFSESRNGFGSGVHFNFSNSGKVYSREALNRGPTAGHQGEDWGFHSVSGTGASHKKGALTTGSWSRSRVSTGNSKGHSIDIQGHTRQAGNMFQMKSLLQHTWFIHPSPHHQQSGSLVVNS